MAIIPPGVEIGGCGLVRTSNLMVDDRPIQDIDALDTVVYPSLDIISDVPFTPPLVIVPGGGSTPLVTFNLPSGLRQEGGFYLLIGFDATISGATSEIDASIIESSGKWTPFVLTKLAPPALVSGAGQVTYFICPLDAGIWTPNSANTGPTPPVGDITILASATCDNADLLTINRAALLGSKTAAIPIVGPVF